MMNQQCSQIILSPPVRSKLPMTAFLLNLLGITKLLTDVRTLAALFANWRVSLVHFTSTMALKRKASLKTVLAGHAVVLKLIYDYYM